MESFLGPRPRHSSSPSLSILLLGLIISNLSQLCFAEPKGGFFNKEELDRGFFADPTANPTAEPVATAAPQPTKQSVSKSVPTEMPIPPPISNADVAREVIKGGSEAVERIKVLQSDPTKKDQLMQSLQGVRDSLDQQLHIQSPNSIPTEARPTPVSLVPPENLLNDYHPDEMPAQIIVILKADPRNTFLRTLDKIFVAITQLKVTVTQIYIIGQNRDLEQYLPDRQETFENLKYDLLASDIPPSVKRETLTGLQEAVSNTQILLEKLNFKLGSSKSTAQELIKKYQLLSSPAWIVNTGEKTTIIQGSIDPREFLTAEGKLNPELRESELGGTPFGSLKDPSDSIVTEFDYVPPPVTEPVRKTVLPICTKARIRRLQVGPATFGSFFSPEMLIYSPEDPEQLQMSEQYAGTTVAYPSSSAQAESANPLLPFMLSLPLRCLPTRLHYLNVGGRQYMELRQGEAAWKD